MTAETPRGHQGGPLAREAIEDEVALLRAERDAPAREFQGEPRSMRPIICGWREGPDAAKVQRGPVTRGMAIQGREGIRVVVVDLALGDQQHVLVTGYGSIHDDLGNMGAAGI